jgi:hypothetical protein
MADLPDGVANVGGMTSITTTSPDTGRRHVELRINNTAITSTNALESAHFIPKETNQKSFEAFLHIITHDTMHLDPQKADGKLNPRELMKAAETIDYHGEVFSEANKTAIIIDPKFEKALKEYADKKHIDVAYFKDVDASECIKPAIFNKSTSDKNCTPVR